MGLDKNQPSNSPPPPQFSNHNPSTSNYTDVTNIDPKSSSDSISTTQSGRLVKRNRKYFGAIWESLFVFLVTLSPRTQFAVDCYIIRPYFDMHVEPHPFNDGSRKYLYDSLMRTRYNDSR